MSADKTLAEQIRELTLRPDLVEVVRKKVEDQLIDMRDSGMFMANSNGLAVFGKDGSNPGVIRIGTGMAVSMILELVARRLEEETP